MDYQEFTWTCDGRLVSIGVDRAGDGPRIVLLPALSSISTRLEMRPLQMLLAQSFEAIALDWPGFGDLAKPYVDWRPKIYQAYLRYLFAEVVPAPFAVIAAGHAAGYVIEFFAATQREQTRLVLLSPTWQGPLPTMSGGHRPILARLAKAFDPPLRGALLYHLNVNRLVVGMMARGHVYADPDWLDHERMAQKLAVTRAPGARHGSARFVTGCLDPFRSRQQQIEVAQRVRAPMLVAFAENAPHKSRHEMEALAALSNVETARLPRGKLSFYEEFPQDTAAATLRFLSGGRDHERKGGPLTNV
jgi:alpha-beta hydrolase superfamily lysophospholipase